MSSQVSSSESDSDIAAKGARCSLPPKSLR